MLPFRRLASALLLLLFVATSLRFSVAQLDGDELSADLLEADENLEEAIAEVKRGRRRGGAKRPKAPVVRHEPSIVEHLLAGSVGGVAGVIAGYPLDTVRVRMQTAKGNRKNALGSAMELMRCEGAGALYRGILSPVTGAAFIKSSVFFSYGLCQGVIRKMAVDGFGARGGGGAAQQQGGGGTDSPAKLTLPQLGLAAAGSGFFASFVVTPVERVKVIMQNARMSDGVVFPSSLACARGLIKEQGLRKGLWLGLGPTLAREVPGYGLYFFAYELSKQTLSRLAERVQEEQRSALPPPLVLLEPVLASPTVRVALSGAAAGVASWLPVYPVDVVKSRMQSSVSGGKPFGAVAKAVWTEGGPRAFYRGIGPTLCRAVVAHATTFLVYEAVVLQMRKVEEKGWLGRWTTSTKTNPTTK